MYYYTLVPLAALLINVYAISTILSLPKKNDVDRAFLYFAGVSTLWSALVFSNSYFFKSNFVIIMPILGRIIGYSITFFILHFTYVLIKRKKDLIYYLSLSSFIIFTFLVLFFNSHRELFELAYHGTVFKIDIFTKIISAFSFMHYALVFMFVLKRILKDKTPFLKNPLMLLLSGFFIRLILLSIFSLISFLFNLPIIDSTAFGGSLEIVIFLYLGKKFRFLTIGLNEINNAILQNAKVGIIAITETGFISVINKTAVKILNLDENTYFSNIKCIIDDTSLLTDQNSFEIKVKHADGINTAEIKVFAIKQKSINLGKLLILTDITENKKIREEARLSEAKFRAVVENSTDPIIMFNPSDGRFIFANNALFNLSGYSKDEVYNKLTLYDFVPASFAKKEKMDEWIENITLGNSKNSKVNEAELLTKEKKILNVIASSSVIEFNNDVAVVSILKDISARKHLEEEREMLILDLGKANEELKKLIVMKNDFLAVASHDLRSPFNSIIGFSDLLLDDETLEDKHKRFIKNINISAKIQLDYINDLLDILKMESGEIRLSKSKIKISDLINLSCDAIIILASKKDIDINIEIEKDTNILVDVPKIVQVLNNLISNAIKFTQKGGNINIKSYPKETLIYFHIIDDGIGIPDNKLKLIFKTYKQVYTKGTEGEKGTGLGLTICKKMVEAHHGEIFVKSTQEQGSDFYFYLPS